MSTTFHIVGFFAQPRELRDAQYINALSNDGKTIQFTLVKEEDGRDRLRGPNVAALMRSCAQVHAEMQYTINHALTLHLDSGTRSPFQILRQLNARSTENLYIEHFSSFGSAWQ